MPWPEEQKVIIVPLLPPGQRVVTRMYVPSRAVQTTSIGTDGYVVYIAVPLGVQRLDGYRVEVRYEVSDEPNVFVIYEHGRPPQAYEIGIHMELDSVTSYVAALTGGDEPMDFQIVSSRPLPDGKFECVVSASYAGVTTNFTMIVQTSVTLVLVETIPPVVAVA